MPEAPMASHLADLARGSEFERFAHRLGWPCTHACCRSRLRDNPASCSQLLFVITRLAGRHPLSRATLLWELPDI